MENIIQQQSFQPNSEVIFTVNKDIKPEDPSKLPKTSQEDSLKARSKTIQAWKSDCPDTLLTHTSGNGFVNCVRLAYAFHYNLELSPDDIWLAVLQGFSNHLELNHEKLKKQFVNFDGKQKLVIRRDNFIWGSNENDWSGCFEEWCEQIKKYIGNQNYSNLLPNFSQKSEISQACFHATIMDSMKNYFEFGIETACGIPQVKLTGSLEDWKQLKEKVKNLGQYDLEWWTEFLIPILDKFIESYEGKIDEIFWNCIYKVVPPGEFSGSVTTVTGWIINFFPYISQYDGKIKNEKLTHLEGIYKNYEDLKQDTQENDEEGEEFEEYADFNHIEGILRENHILGGVTETPFKWEYLEEEKDMTIIAGFHNICYENNFIKPAKGWAITEEQEKEQTEEY